MWHGALLCRDLRRLLDEASAEVFLEDSAKSGRKAAIENGTSDRRAGTEYLEPDCAGSIGQSRRSASSGATLRLRSAGGRAASSATARNTRIAAAKLAGSPGPIP